MDKKRHQAHRSDQPDAKSADTSNKNSTKTIPPRLEIQNQDQAGSSRSNQSLKTPNTPKSGGNKTPLTPREPPVQSRETPLITKFFRLGRDEALNDNEQQYQKAPNSSDDENQAQNAREAPLNISEQKKIIKDKLGQIVLDELDQEFSRQNDRQTADSMFVDSLPYRLSKRLSARLNKLKTVYVDYKFISHVVVSRKSDDMKLDIRCCWDEKEDVFQNTTYSDKNIHCVVSVLAVRS